MLKTAENVEFFLFLGRELAAVNHVEQVDHHESLEQQGVVEHAVGRLTGRSSEFSRDQVVANVEHSRACIQHNNHHDELVDNLGKDGAPHNRGNEAVFLLDAVGREILFRSFSSKGNSSEDVHDQVNPKKLNNVERRHSCADSTQDDNGQAAEVHSELELKELANIVNNVATLFHSLSH